MNRTRKERATLRQQEVREPEVREQHIRWTKIIAPKPWTPKQEGSELEGTYAGSYTATGNNGNYSAHIINTYTNCFRLSGVVITGLIEAACLAPDSVVRIVFKGMKETVSGHYYKDFDLYVER